MHFCRNSALDTLEIFHGMHPCDQLRFQRLMNSLWCFANVCILNSNRKSGYEDLGSGLLVIDRSQRELGTSRNLPPGLLAACTTLLLNHDVNDIPILHFQLRRSLRLRNAVPIEQKANGTHRQAAAAAVGLHELLQRRDIFALEVNLLSVIVNDLY